MVCPDEIYKGLKRKDSNKTIKEAYKVITEHFKAEFVEERKFRQMKGRQDEPVHDFVLRLRQQAMNCMLGDTYEPNILRSSS